MATLDEPIIINIPFDRSGRFTVMENGVYQLTFTALFVAIRGHMVSTRLLITVVCPKFEHPALTSFIIFFCWCKIGLQQLF